MSTSQPGNDSFGRLRHQHELPDELERAERIVFHVSERAKHVLQHFGGDRGQAVVAFPVGGEEDLAGFAAEISEPYFCHTPTVRSFDWGMYRTMII